MGGFFGSYFSQYAFIRINPVNSRINAIKVLY